MRKNIVALILFLIGTVSLKSFVFTANVIGTNFLFSSNLFLGLIFIFGSLIVLVSRQGLDAILTPTGPGDSDKKRTFSAYPHYLKNPSDYFVVSGAIGREDGRVRKDTQVYQIYNQLRSYGIKPSQMIIEGKAKNTIENVLYSLEKLKQKGVKEVGIVTGKTHYARFKEMVEKAKEENLIDRNFKIYPVYVSENTKEKIYGVLAYLKDHFKLNRYGLRGASEHSDLSVGDKLKKILESK